LKKLADIFFTERKMQFNIESVKTFFTVHLHKLSADTLGWLAAIVLHCATLPSLLALMTGLSDNTPSIDIVLLLWTGLVLLFVKAIVLKDSLNIITIGVGFIAQAVMMALLLFK
jgi:hypothetical protein